MKVKCITESEGLEIDKEYRVVVVHAEGYELENDSNVYDVNLFTVIDNSVPNNEEDPYFMVLGMTYDEYVNEFGEEPPTIELS